MIWPNKSIEYEVSHSSAHFPSQCQGWPNRIDSVPFMLSKCHRIYIVFKSCGVKVSWKRLQQINEKAVNPKLKMASVNLLTPQTAGNPVFNVVTHNTRHCVRFHKNLVTVKELYAKFQCWMSTALSVLLCLL